MRKIRLSNGAEYPVDRCGVSGDMLLVRVTEGNLLDLVMVFGRPENTATIEHWFEGTETDHVTYEGYTELRTASQEREGVMMLLYRQ